MYPVNVAPVLFWGFAHFLPVNHLAPLFNPVFMGDFAVPGINPSAYQMKNALNL